MNIESLLDYYSGAIVEKKEKNSRGIGARATTSSGGEIKIKNRKDESYRRALQNIHKDNPVTATLLSKMGYTKREKIEVKIAFLRM